MMNGNLGRKVTQRSVVTGILALVFLGVDTSPTTSSVPSSIPEPPDLEHVAMLEDLAAWMVGPAADRRQIDTLARAGLSQLIREEPRRFELFRAHLDRRAERNFLRSLPYGDEIGQTAARHRLDGLLLAALVEAESSFLPDAISPVGAVGLTQVMPATAAWLGGKGDLTDPDSNLELGALYLSRMIDRFDGDLELALAAYNAGPTNVLRYGGVPPFRETRSYVRKVLSIYAGHNWQVWQSAPDPALLAMN